MSESCGAEFDLDVAVVGAGAAGVGIGVVLRDLGLDSFALLERDVVGASFRRWPDEMRFITPSFPGSNFGCRDLNSITKDTSPAFALDREHPTGEEYAEYLGAVVEFHDLPVRTGVGVGSIDALEEGFVLRTTNGDIHSRFVILATGQFGAPNDDSFPGAEHCVHNSRVGSWERYAEECVDDSVLVIGGYESGIDAALALSQLGHDITVLDEAGPWQFRGPDPSEVLSPHTKQRLEGVLATDAPIDLRDGIRVEHVEQTNGTFDVLDSNSVSEIDRSVGCEHAFESLFRVW
jgi:cation diffusion facilitator CzcD-associated flavoprotein CzcO